MRPRVLKRERSIHPPPGPKAGQDADGKEYQLMDEEEGMLEVIAAKEKELIDKLPSEIIMTTIRPYAQEPTPEEAGPAGVPVPAVH